MTAPSRGSRLDCKPLVILKNNLIFKLQHIESIPQSLRDSSLYTREPLKCSILACLASILHLLISLPLTREVARRSRDGGERKDKHILLLFRRRAMGCRGRHHLQFIANSAIKAAGASPRPTRYNFNFSV